MSKLPRAGPETEGRTFGMDWSIANVATLLRANAGRGIWRSTGATGGQMAKVNQNYLRTVSARHLPTGVSVIFMRLEGEGGWYASLCCADEELVERWLWALFDEDRPRVVEEEAADQSRQFILNRTGPVLRG
jgi:hypothetical protein